MILRLNFNILEKLIDKRELLFIKSENDIDENIINDFKNYDVVVDGIFGVGLNKDLTGMFKKSYRIYKSLWKVYSIN